MKNIFTCMCLLDLASTPKELENAWSVCVKNGYESELENHYRKTKANM